MRSNSRNNLETPETHFPRKQNVEKNATRRTMRLTPGGMLLKRIRETSPISRFKHYHKPLPISLKLVASARLPTERKRLLRSISKSNMTYAVLVRASSEQGTGTLRRTPQPLPTLASRMRRIFMPNSKSIHAQYLFMIKSQNSHSAQP